MDQFFGEGSPPEYRERAIFLGHDILAQEVRVELVEHARTVGQELTRWETGPSAIVGAVRPDAWFTYRLPKGTLVGFVEADRGSEGKDIWLGKQEQYTGLFTGDNLAQAIGFRRGWVLAVTETVSRAKQIAGWLIHERIRVVCVGEVATFIESVVSK